MLAIDTMSSISSNSVPGKAFERVLFGRKSRLFFYFFSYLRMMDESAAMWKFVILSKQGKYNHPPWRVHLPLCLLFFVPFRFFALFNPIFPFVLSAVAPFRERRKAQILIWQFVWATSTYLLCFLFLLEEWINHLKRIDELSGDLVFWMKWFCRGKYWELCKVPPVFFLQRNRGGLQMRHSLNGNQMWENFAKNSDLDINLYERNIL